MGGISSAKVVINSLVRQSSLRVTRHALRIINTGYAVSPGGEIIKTTNGGANWTTQTSGSINDLNFIFFKDANTGYIVGDQGTILKTTNGGTTSINEARNGSSNLHIYPTPATLNVTLEKEQTPGTKILTVYSSTGQFMLEKELKALTAQLDISAWPGGLYLVKVEISQSIEWGKIVK
jgi:hypothetical protein